MKEQKWDDSIEESKDIFEMAAAAVEEDVAEEPKASSTSNITELRRRIEERLDSKRIALEYDFDDLDDLTENFQ